MLKLWLCVSSLRCVYFPAAESAREDCGATQGTRSAHGKAQLSEHHQRVCVPGETAGTTERLQGGWRRVSGVWVGVGVTGYGWVDKGGWVWTSVGRYGFGCRRIWVYVYVHCPPKSLPSHFCFSTLFNLYLKKQ